jgi:Flp pilus assembly protein TadG
MGAEEAAKPIGRLRRVWLRFVADRRGATAVQAIVILPVVIVFIGLGMKLWETVNIRKSLHHGTYLATRYLSMYPPFSTLNSDWEDIVRRYVEAELLSNPFVDPAYLQRDLNVIVSLDESNDCGDTFTVNVEYGLYAPSTIGRLSLPQNTLVALRESIRGEVVCD